MEPPEYVWVTAVVDVSARRGASVPDVRDGVLRVLYALFDPATGGPDGTGWPLGRAVRAHEVHGALQRAVGVDLSQETTVQLFPADAATQRRGAPTDLVVLPANGLVHSFDHQVRVRP